MSNVAAGAYAISARTILNQSSDNAWRVTCRIQAAGATIDTAEFSYGSTDAYVAPLSMQTTQVFGSTVSIVVSCNSNLGATATMTKIVAVELAGTTREAVTG